MKPRHIIKAQRARLMFDLAVRRLSGEITSNNTGRCASVLNAHL